MPRIVRPMRVEPDQLPRVGARSKCLGVREPPDPNADVNVDGAGSVVQNRKGMSVADDWRQLPGHLIPEHLDDGFNGASGRGMNVFVHGCGFFQQGPVTATLELLLKAGTVSCGVVAPTARVSLARYQQDLMATRGNWFIDES